MYVCNKHAAEQRPRPGMTSYFLLGSHSVEDTPLAVTWVDVEPGGRQLIHHHPETQVYVIIEGAGIMHVGGETQAVKAGDLAYIPSNANHGLENTGAGVLRYVSAATPAMDLIAAYDHGPHTPEQYRE